jgi:Peptidase family M13
MASYKALDQEEQRDGDLELNMKDMLDEQEQRRKRSHLFIIGGCIILLFAFMTYTKTPCKLKSRRRVETNHQVHMRNCAHHLSLHLHPKQNDMALANSRLNVKRDVNSEEKADVCETEACKKYSQTILNNMSPNWKALDPCDNFDAFSCDGFREHQEIKSFKTGISTMEIVRDEVDDIILGLFNGSVPFSSSQTGSMKAPEQSNYNTMKKVWDSCMNEDAMTEYGVKPIQKVLEEFEKLFPVKGPAVSGGSNEELTNLVIWMQGYGANGILSAESTV